MTSNFKFQISNFKNAGFIFLEILIAIALISIVFVTLLGLAFLSLNLSSSIEKTIQADDFVREEIEILRSWRDGTTWATNGLGTVNIGPSFPYHLVLDASVNPNKWNLVAGAETIGGFTRSIVFDRVFRDSNGNIVTSGGTEDLYTKKVTVNISFSSKTYNVITYLTNWQNK